MASLTSGMEIAVIIAVAVSIVLVAGRLTRGATVATPALGFGFRDFIGFKAAPRALGRSQQPRGTFVPWLHQRLNSLVAGFARALTGVAVLAGKVTAPARSSASPGSVSGSSVSGTGLASIKSLPFVIGSKRASSAISDLPRLTADMQWDRVSRMVNRAVDGAAQIRSVHSTAAVKIDAADYEFERLLSELGGVMKLKQLSGEIAEFPLAQRTRGVHQSGARAAA